MLPSRTTRVQTTTFYVDPGAILGAVAHAVCSVIES
jgi:hypothetical protein